VLYRGQVDDQVAGGAEQTEDLLAQGGTRLGAEVPAEHGDDVAAAVCPGGKTEAGFISRGVRHGVFPWYVGFGWARDREPMSGA
jgi:hypothetical protein